MDARLLDHAGAMHWRARQPRSLTMSRQKLELPKAEDIREHSARFADRGKPERTEVAGAKEREEVLQSLRADIQKLEKSAELDVENCSGLLRKCSFHKALEEGKCLHRYIDLHSQTRNIFLKNLLVLMYGSCRRIREAREVFDRMEERNSHSWNIMVAAYTQNGHLREALDLYWSMDTSVQRCSVIYCTALGVCSKLGAIAEGRQIHRSISGTLYETFGGAGSVGTALVNMYGKCASPDEARTVFDKLTHKTNVCWNAMISAYAQNQRDAEAILLFRNMDLEGLKATEITFVSVIDACTKNRRLARQVHARVAALGLTSDMILSSALVNMYGKSGMADEARRVFDGMERRNCYTWSGMIAAYAHNGQCRQALELFRRMDVKPNNVTFISVLDACSKLGDITTGKLVHARYTPTGQTLDVTLGNALINMYGKCGDWKSAREVFESMPKKSVITWTSMIAAYSQNGLSKEALDVYQKMDAFELRPNPITIISVLDACAEGGALKDGRKIHRQLLDNKIEPDGVLGNAIVNMYGKCGSLTEAWEVFRHMKNRSVVSWTSILAAFAEQGDGSEAFLIHKHMCLEGVQPDDVTFISMLFACSHAGKLEKGIEVFQAMISDFYRVPEPEHFRCMVDLLARSGKLADAEALIRSMPFEEDIVSWSTLLSGCKLHSNEEHGKAAADRVVEMSPGHSGGYLLLSHIHAGGKVESRRYLLGV